MNKPILAACAGVTFGLFLGGIIVSGSLSGSSSGRSCCRRTATDTRTMQTERVTMQPQRVVITSTVIHHNGEVVHSETRQQIAETLSDADADSLSAAQTAYVNGDYAKAIQLAKCASKDSPIRAERVIGAAACSLGDAEQATAAYRRLDVPGRQYVTYVCQRSGLVIRGSAFQKVN